MEYKVYGRCTDSTGLQLKIVQLNEHMEILWKFLEGEEYLVLIGILRCILAPLLLVLIIAIVVLTAQSAPKEPIPRF